MKYLAILLILTACATPKKYVEYPMVAKEVYPSANCTVHKFESITGKYSIDVIEDTAICAKSDTIKIRIQGKKLLFIK